MNTEPLTPDELTAENELICQKLLNWRRTERKWAGDAIWDDSEGIRVNELIAFTPRFDTWDESGLILDWLNQRVGPWMPEMRTKLGSLLHGRQLTPLAIRAAALEYIRRQP